MENCFKLLFGDDHKIAFSSVKDIQWGCEKFIVPLFGEIEDQKSSENFVMRTRKAMKILKHYKKQDFFNKLVGDMKIAKESGGYKEYSKLYQTLEEFAFSEKIGKE